MWPKIERFMKTHLTSVYTTYEVDGVISIMDSGGKPTAAVFQATEAENLIISENLHKQSIDQVDCVISNPKWWFWKPPTVANF